MASHEWYGDDVILARQYETMKRYVQYLKSKSKNSILTGGLGDWYDLGPKAPGYSQLTPISLTATAFYFKDAQLLARTAALLDLKEDAALYDSLALQIRDRFNQTFYHPQTHTYAGGSQTANAMALSFHLASEADRQSILDNVVADIRKHRDGLTAGDIGYRYLLAALAEGGRSDVIFDMNCRSDRPGYGMMISKGATSLTEAWDGRPESSQDHFMLGHIMEWFYGSVAGIQPDPTRPGFKQILIRPTPVGDLTWAKADYNSIRGKISSGWEIHDETFSLDVKIPPNCTAVVELPKAFRASVSEGGRPVAQSTFIKIDAREPERPRMLIPSGTFHFESHAR